MKTLGIDYGRRKVGIAIAEFSLATPIATIPYDSEGQLYEELKRLIQREEIERIVVGVSEGEMEEESREFGRQLMARIDFPLYFQDETLSTIEAQRLSREAGKGPKKRKEMEDAYAAALILQDFLDHSD